MSEDEQFEDVPTTDLVAAVEDRGLDVHDPDDLPADPDRLSTLVWGAIDDLNCVGTDIYQLAGEYPDVNAERIRENLLNAQASVAEALDHLAGLGFSRQVTFRGEADVQVFDGPMLVEDITVTDAEIVNPHGVTHDLDPDDALRTGTAEFATRGVVSGHEFRNLPDEIGSKPTTIEGGDETDV